MMFLEGFQRPEALWLIPAVLMLVGAIFWWGKRRKVRFMMAFRAPHAGGVRRLPILLAALTLSSLGLAAAGPFMVGSEKKPVLRAVIAIDNSWSMYADDYPCPTPLAKPNAYCPDASRFQRVRADLTRLFERFRDVDIALVTFAGKPYVWSSHLTDVDAILWMIQNPDWIRPGFTTNQGSELGTALSESYACPVPRDKKRRCLGVLGVIKEEYPDGVPVLLFSDGADADNTSTLSPAADAYRKAHAPIIALSYGKKTKSITVTPVAYADDGAQTQQEPVTLQATFNEEPLRYLADSTGGAYRQSVTGQEILEVFDEQSELLQTVDGKSAAKDLFQIAGGTGFVFFLLLLFLIL